MVGSVNNGYQQQALIATAFKPADSASTQQRTPQQTPQQQAVTQQQVSTSNEVNNFARENTRPLSDSTQAPTPRGSALDISV